MTHPHVRLAESQREMASLAERATQALEEGRTADASVWAHLATASALSAVLLELAEIRKALGR